jgi:alanyl-tRNA synthetase
MKSLTGAEIRESFIDFFVEHGHTAVPSGSLVPGGDATLLFTNSGMVQFKDVFLGKDKRPYKRAVDSQKCLRVAGKHNDLDEVGRDDTHHTFFEMLGNWSFGDYYKKEAIEWAWQLLTDVWGLDRNGIWATCFEGEKNVPSDEEAAGFWRQQPGFAKDHVLYFGRNDNFWEMAETGPCGPCSEIHYDRGLRYCNMQDVPGHVCKVNGECTRFLELWNLVFMQYNRLGPDRLEPLPATHVDTGLGFERIVSVLQDVDSNYKTDLFAASLEALRSLSGHTEKEMRTDFTPYRVIADHTRSAAFLIADGVVPGNVGRNYVCRMIIRRAARFGTKIGLTEPFLARVADAVISTYGAFYPELQKSRGAILDSLTREEMRFDRTIESGVAQLQSLLDGLTKQKKAVLEGGQAFDLYATYGLPLEISRDIAREQSLDVDEAGFRSAMDAHRIASGGGKAMGKMGGEDAEFYAAILRDLQKRGKVAQGGVAYDPYTAAPLEGELLALIVEGVAVGSASFGDPVEVLLPQTGFYMESGGQVADQGIIRSAAAGPAWEVEITDVRRPSAGVIVHVGEVISGQPKVGDQAIAEVDMPRRHDIMRNHTATHLLHAALHEVLGDHARQAGSLVAPDRLRFDFNHPEAMTAGQVQRVERIVNEAVAADMEVVPRLKARAEAIAEGAMALFGEKYGETVRTITIVPAVDSQGQVFPGGAAAKRAVTTDHIEAVQAPTRYSYELCGGTHLERTSDVGMFLIVSEGSAAAGVRRIEAVTGRGAYALVTRRLRLLENSAAALKSSLDDVPLNVASLQDELDEAKRRIAALRQKLARSEFDVLSKNPPNVSGVPYLVAKLTEADAETLRSMIDAFRQDNSGGIILLGSVVDNKPFLVSSTDHGSKFDFNAIDIVKVAAGPLGGSGGGRPNLAQAGGKYPDKLEEALEKAREWIVSKLSKK